MSTGFFLLAPVRKPSARATIRGVPVALSMSTMPSMPRESRSLRTAETPAGTAARVSATRVAAVGAAMFARLS